MTLYFMRHAIAVERGTAGYRKDCDRPLTPKGEKRLRKIANGLLALETSIDLILASPYVRTRQTAEVLAETFQKRRCLEFCDELAPRGNPAELIQRILPHLPYSRSVLVVGHEPYLSRLISVLLTGETNLDVKLKKGGLCKLSCEALRYGRCASIDWMAPPRLLAKAA